MIFLDQERLKKKEILVRAQDAFIAELRSDFDFDFPHHTPSLALCQRAAILIRSI